MNNYDKTISWHSLVWMLLFTFTLLSPLTVEAQANNPSTVATVPTDVVLLNDGGMVRGTLIEVAPNDHVSLMLPNGQMRRFEAADVSYYGPSADAPALTTDPSPATPPGMVQLAFRASAPQVGLYLTTRENRGQRICTAPCEHTLRPGSYHLSLSHGEGRPVLTLPRAIHIDRDVRLFGRYQSHRAMRIGGWVIFGLALPSTVASFVYASQCKDGCNEISRYFVAAGSLALTLVGLFMTAHKDTARIEVEVPRE